MTAGKDPGSDNNRDHEARGDLRTGVDKGRPGFFSLSGAPAPLPRLLLLCIPPFVRIIDTNEELRIKIKFVSLTGNAT